MATTRLSVRRSRKSARSKTSESLSSEPSPDSKCPICLDVFHNMSYLDLCLHKFCFRCIHEWSKNKAECPLCKQPFNSIYHSIKSEKDFKKYDLRAAENGSFGSFGSFGGGARFRYRTTLTGVRRQQAQRRTSPPPDNGVMFESLSVAHPLQLQERTLRHMMARLAARRKAASEGREVRQLREQEMVTFRRELYRRGVRVRSVRDGGRSRDTSAEFYQRNPACLHRLIPWLKRELMVLYGAHGSLVNIVQHIIMSRITRHDMEDGAIQDELSPFLQGRTEHFLHEFISFAKSPFNMEAYDQHAAYDLPAPSSNEVTSSNSSVIAISEDEQDSPVELDPPGDSIYSSGGALSESAWDDETPGPSYSTMVCLESSRSQPLSILDSDSDSSTEEEGGQGETMQECRAPTKQESHHPIYSSPLGKGLKNGGLSSDDDDSDCVIVGFVKPVRERTPELVQLSSDSSEEVSPSHRTTEEVPMLPQHIRFVSVSPPASQCGEQRSRRSDSTEQEHNEIGSRGRCSNPTVIRHKLSNEPSERRSSRPSERRSRDRHSRDRHSRDRLDRNSRGTRYSRSRERQRTRSRDRRRASKSRDLSRSRGRRPSPSRSRDRLSHSKRDSRDRKMDGDHNGGTLNTERRSYYSKCHSRSSNRRSYSRSRSRSQGQESSSRDKHSRHPRSGSQSPSAKRKSRHDKPGGKRKYKTRHLEEPTKELLPEPDSSTASCTKEKKSKSRHRKKSKEKSRKKSRSLSVEIVYDGSSSEKTMRHHKKKKKHKKKSKRHKSKERTGKHSSTVITIDSDSDHPANDCSVTQASSDNKDNRLNPADSTVLESMTGEMERQSLTVGVNTVTKQESSQAVGASEPFKQSCVPHVEGETVED